MRPKGLYIVTEYECLRPGSGAHNHITVGMNELSKDFDMELHSPWREYLLPTRSKEDDGPVQSLSPLKGALKDLRDYFLHNYAASEFWDKIVNNEVDFIYERSSYLNFGASHAAKQMGAKHIIETNGVQALDIRDHYPSLLNKWVWGKETSYYSKADLVCFVGSQAEFMNYTGANQLSIENGIHSEDIDSFKNEKIDDGKVHMVFLGHKIPHHHFHLLPAALKEMNTTEGLVLHIIGSKFEGDLAFLKNHIELEYHGVLDKDKVRANLGKFHLGLITGGREYNSFMKLPEYGASEIAVLAPDLHNLKRVYADSEMIFFQKENVKDFASKLEDIRLGNYNLSKIGSLLNKKVQSELTWDQIYKPVRDKISKLINS